MEASQLDIAPTIASIYGVSIRCDGKVLSEAYRRFRGLKTILVIVDSLGYSEYLRYRGLLGELDAISRRGILYRCLACSGQTTPAIATILTGLSPERHRIYRTGDAYTSEIRSLPEILSERGFSSGVVMEEYGAGAFIGRIDAVRPIPRDLGIQEFDSKTTIETIGLVRDGVEFIVAHLRVLDRLGYTGEALALLDGCIARIRAEAAKNSYILVVCGDHPPHNSAGRHVALIFGV